MLCSSLSGADQVNAPVCRKLHTMCCHTFAFGARSKKQCTACNPHSYSYSRLIRVLMLVCVHLRSHEEMSGEILQTIIDDGHIKDDALDDIDMKRVQQLIVGSCPNHQPAGNASLPPNDKRFLFDIVANGRNSIDVDKFDYLARDSHYCNVKVSCDLNRLQRLTKVATLCSLHILTVGLHMHNQPTLYNAVCTKFHCHHKRQSF